MYNTRMISRYLALTSVLVLTTCAAVNAQTPTPTPGVRIEERRLGFSFRPEPVTGRSQKSAAISMTGEKFNVEYKLPEPSGGDWYTGPDPEDPAAMSYLIPVNGVSPDLTISQKFEGQPADSLETAIAKVQEGLKWTTPAIEDLSAGGIKGKVFSYSMPPIRDSYPHYIRIYVFSFNNSLFRVAISSALKDRMEWVRKSGDEFVKSFRISK